MSIAPVRFLRFSLAARLVLTVLVLTFAVAALVVMGWAVVEALHPSGSVPLAPGPLPLPSPQPGQAG